MNKPPVSDNFDIGWIHKDAKCWVYFPTKQSGDIYVRGTVAKINPLNFNKSNSLVKGHLQNGTEFQAKAFLLQKCRQSRSIQKDLIEMDIINGAEVLNQIKKRFQDKKIHTYLWNSLIIVNPFELVAKNYSQMTLHYYYEQIFLKQDLILSKVQPHIYAFVFNILRQIKHGSLIQVLSISGQSGSGKTQTNKQCLRAISYGCQKEKLKSHKQLPDQNLQLKILQCDPILEAFGNAKTVKNDNSSRFGKLITIKVDSESMSIQQSSIRNYFLQKSRIISQSPGERNFHIFYLMLKFMPQVEKNNIKLRGKHGPLKLEDFKYISQKNSYVGNHLLLSQKEMWNDLVHSFKNLDFKKQQVNQIWSVVAAVLLLGNIGFDGTLQNENDPCEITHPDLVASVAHLLKIKKEEIEAGLIFHKKVIAGQLMHIPLTAKQCQEGRDSIAKAIYEGLFTWIVQELNLKVNEGEKYESTSQCNEVKLLDIYGFEVFQKNSFQQLCVNFTNQKIHQIYLEQVFIQQKKILKSQGLQSSIPHLNFTDNFKIIELIESSPKSIYNLLDESCTLNVKDLDFLANIRKNHQHHEHFPPANSTNIRNSFIIKHTPGQIQYMVEGFRDKNKDLLREDIVYKLSQSQSSVVKSIFEQKLESMKTQSNKKYLGIKVRKQVKELISQMSTNSNLHFVRCIKPNEQKKAFTFVDRVSYNQIKYLGILDTIQMRKESYHVRIPYEQFYKKYGILEQKGLNNLIELQEGQIPTSQCRDMSMRVMTSNIFTNHKLEYLFGKERMFMKISTKNFLDIVLKQKTNQIEFASTVIKAHYRRKRLTQLKQLYQSKIPKIQQAVRNYLAIVKTFKKKKSVLVIEAYWIKYCHQFFLRKRRKYVVTLQKYVKRAVQVQRQKKMADAILLIKGSLKSALQTHHYANYADQFLQVKQVIKKDIYDKIWEKMSEHYKKKAKVYLKAFAVRRKNRQSLYESQKIALQRQSVKAIKSFQKYFKGFVVRTKVESSLINVRKVQNYIRMRKYRTKYNNLKQKAIKIQRTWRKYSEFKKMSILNTQKYFEQKMRDQKQKIGMHLFRKLKDSDNKSNYYPDPALTIQDILHQNDKIKRDKIGVFYYLLDFQMLCPLDYIYPEGSWIENYTALYKQSMERGNPIQYVDVSNTHTICTTINKIYQWGEIREEQAVRTQKFCENIPTPNCRINKVKACEGFTIIETEEPQELLIMGNQKQYEESSIKEWSTLKDSYVLLNGVILTLKNHSLTKLPISQKVTHLYCGMAHILCKTSLKKIFSWGQNKMGQLGHGHFHRVLSPKPIQFFNKHKIVVAQIGVTAFGSVVLDLNSKVWWFGSNGTIENQPTPKEAFLPLKSEFIDNSKKYSVLRIIPKWSKSISLIGVTVAAYEGAFKTTQTAMRKKCLQNMMVKWAEDIETINPPYVQSISCYFSEKHMYFKKASNKKSEGENLLTYQQIKNKLVNEMMMIEHAEKKLLNTIREEYNSKGMESKMLF